MATDYSLSLRDYVAMLKRHTIAISIIIITVSLAALLVAALLPPTYEASGTILLVPQEISSDLVPESVSEYADQKVAMVRQRVMTRDNLIAIVHKFRLYEEHGKPLPTSQALDFFRQNISIDPIIDPEAKANNRTIAFRVSFIGLNPNIVSDVDNELVTLFLNENAKVGLARANDATTFLGQQASNLRDQLDKVGKQVADFKMQNSNALPENKDVLMSSYQATESALQETARSYQATQDEITNLEIELTAAKAGDVSNTNDNSAASDPTVELARLETEYSKLSAIYNDNHPTMVMLRSKIATLKKTIASSSGTSNMTDNPVTAQIEAKIRAAQSQLSMMAQQEASLRGRLAAIEHDLLREPQVEQQLSVMQVNYDAIKKKYDDLRGKQSAAQETASLQEENKAERFELIDPPVMPDRPIKPNRIKIALAGILFSVAAAVGLTILLESSQQKVRGTAATTAIMRAPPLVVIPEIRSPAEIAHRKRQLHRGVWAIVITTIIAILIIHLFVIPLDVLIHKLMNYSTVPAKGLYGKV
jgi:polysaccharide chain length determinant protein (PEP-CTERM system associated)